MGIGGAFFFSAFCIVMAIAAGTMMPGIPKFFVLVPLGMAAFAIFSAVQSNRLGKRMEEEATEAQRVDREMRASAPRTSDTRSAVRYVCAYCGRMAGDDEDACEGCGAPATARSRRM